MSSVTSNSKAKNAINKLNLDISFSNQLLKETGSNQVGLLTEDSHNYNIAPLNSKSGLEDGNLSSQRNIFEGIDKH